MMKYFLTTSTYKPFLVLFLIGILQACDKDEPMEIPEPVLELNDAVSVYLESEVPDDYLLVTPASSSTTFLIDRSGKTVKTWSSPGSSCFMAYLRPDGSVVRNLFTTFNDGINIGGNTGRLEIINKNNEIVWSYDIDNTQETLHHDIALLPNGNILALLWEVIPRSQCESLGRDPSTLDNNRLIMDKVVEIKPVGTNQAEIVWQWRMADHLVQDFDATKSNFGSVSQSPQRLDINYNPEGQNYSHVNGIDYIEGLDQIVLSSRVFSELMIIDHGSTTAQAASSTGGRYNKGGDLLYRWGNPQTYKSGTAQDRQLHGQHDVTYVGNTAVSRGNFLVFDNNDGPNFSSIKELQIPLNATTGYSLNPGVSQLPQMPVWVYSNPEIFSDRRSGVTRLPSGNSLIASASGRIIREVNYNGTTVWQYDIALEKEGETKLGEVGFKPRSYPKGFIAL